MGANRWVAGTFAIFVTSLAGCAGGHSVVWEYCASLCRRLQQCYSTGSAGPCHAECVGNPSLRQINEELLTSVGSCYSQQSCASYDAGVAIDTCWDEGGAALVPSAACVEFCEEDTLIAYECGARHSVQDCLEGACTWTDALLEQALDCSVDDCEERFTCQEDAFGVQ